MKTSLLRHALVAGLLAASACHTDLDSVPDAVPESAPGPVNAVTGDASWVETFGEAPGPDAPESLRVATHLAYVERLLRAVDVSHLSLELQAARAQNLDRLQAYWQAGRFPLNTHARSAEDVRVARFVDDDAETAFDDGGPRICAVGFLLSEELGVGAAEEISERFEHASVFEIESEVLAGWAETSGFTLEELAMIQPGYDFMQPRPRPVTDLTPDDVRRVLMTQTRRVNHCVHQALGARDVHPRQIRADVSVAPHGRVESLSITTGLDSAVDSAVDSEMQIQRCVAGAIGVLEFRSGGMRTVKTTARFPIVGPIEDNGRLNLAYLPVVFERANARVQSCGNPFADASTDVLVTATAAPNGMFSDIDVAVRGASGKWARAGGESSDRTTFDARMRSCVASAVAREATPKFKGEPASSSHTFRIVVAHPR